MAVLVTAPPSRLAAPRVRASRRSCARLGAVSAVAVAVLLVASGLQRLVPADTWLDWGSRWLNGLVGLLALATGAAAWAWRRDAVSVLVAATFAPIALLAQAAFDALVEPAALADVVHFGWGLAAVGLLTWTAVGAPPARGVARDLPQQRFFRRVVEVTVGLVFLAVLSGGAVRAAGASWACSGFPTCNGLGLLPLGRAPLMDLHLYHRLLSFAATGLVVWLAIDASRRRAYAPTLARAALVLAGATLAEGAIGVASVAVGIPGFAELLHLVTGTAVWASAVVVAALASRPLIVVPGAVRAEPRSLSTLSAYIQLTKPRVMSLLLLTTAAAMVVAARGLPRLDLLLATLLGGALMSGGAGAINHYVDRDIDPLMGRTAWRPIPSGRVSARRALVFGLVLSALASLVFVVFVNPLATALALIGLLGYVGVYSLWLKRTTPSNIVIGGAAGAVPPLVGWAAVTSDLSVTAWYLFAIVFFWTPPHFWALSLLIQQHYARARVPMLPVVRGEAETRRQILLYAVLVLALTLVLPPLGLMGLPYFGAALLLGGWLVWNALRLWREATPAAARRLYVCSIVYLFALFAAMAVDRSLVISHWSLVISH